MASASSEVQSPPKSSPSETFGAPSASRRRWTEAEGGFGIVDDHGRLGDRQCPHDAGVTLEVARQRQLRRPELLACLGVDRRDAVAVVLVRSETDRADTVVRGAARRADLLPGGRVHLPQLLPGVQVVAGDPPLGDVGDGVVVDDPATVRQTRVGVDRITCPGFSVESRGDTKLRFSSLRPIWS